MTNTKGGNIGSQHLHGFPACIAENSPNSSPAQRFKAKRAAAGKQVEHPGALCLTLQHIEH